MSTLLVWKEQLQKIYAKYSTYIMKALQFMLGLFVFGYINSNVGFMKIASTMVCTIGLSLFCAFLPLVVMIVVATALILLHFYALSLPIALVSVIIFLVMYIFYFRFTPKHAWLILLTPVAFGLKIPFVIPVAFGLIGTPICIVPAAFGTVVYYMLNLVKTSSAAFKGGDAKSLIEGLSAFTKQSLTNKEMWVMVLAITVSLLLVYAIRTMSVDHVWKIGAASGALTSIIIAAVGNIMLNVHIPYSTMIIGGAVAIITGLILEFLFFSVNYSRTERMQFEDDEYYYYVKAVPKIIVSAPEVSVKHINERQEQHDEQHVRGVSRNNQETMVIDASSVNRSMPERRVQRKRRPVPQQKSNHVKIDHGKITDEILLTRSLTKELGLDEIEKNR